MKLGRRLRESARDASMPLDLDSPRFEVLPVADTQGAARLCDGCLEDRYPFNPFRRGVRRRSIDRAGIIRPHEPMR